MQSDNKLSYPFENKHWVERDRWLIFSAKCVVVDVIVNFNKSIFIYERSHRLRQHKIS